MKSDGNYFEQLILWPKATLVLNQVSANSTLVSGDK